MEEIPSEKVEAALKIGGGHGILSKTGVEQILSNRKHHWSAQEGGTSGTWIGEISQELREL